MNLIQQYESEGEQSSTDQHDKNSQLKQQMQISLAPETDISDIINKKQQERCDKIDKMYSQNANPSSKKTITGELSKFHMNNFAFEEQRNNFNLYGYAYDPANSQNAQISQKLVINESVHPELAKCQQKGVISETTQQQLEAFKDSASSAFSSTTANERKRKKELSKKRIKLWDAGEATFRGPWAGYEFEEAAIKELDLTQEQIKALNEKRETLKKQKEENKEQQQQFQATSIFHGQSLTDYQGRSYLLPPQNLKPFAGGTGRQSFIPKKIVHNFTGHTKEVQALQFFPRFGHFILTASYDHKVKLWDVTNKQLTRTYLGHKGAVRDINFTNDGFNFISGAYDKVVQYWDTETGKTVSTFNIKKFPYCVRFNPDQQHQNSFLVANKSPKIFQYDVRSGLRTQVYNEHLGAVNSVTFFGKNKFASTSDDKKIFVWEFGIPVVTIHVSEPEMCPVTSAAVHPNGNHLIGQSSDNKIIVFDCKGNKFRLNKKKKFTGHICAGYAIQVCFSPDGQYVSSGDQDGNVWFWDWKSTKNYRTFKAHDKVCTGVSWHPIEPSKFATCGWDGTLRYWD